VVYLKLLFFWYTIHTFCEVCDNDGILTDVWYWVGIAF